MAPEHLDGPDEELAFMGSSYIDTRIPALGACLCASLHPSGHCDSATHRKRNVPRPICAIRIDDNYRA